MEPSRFEAQLSSLPLRHASVSRGLTIHSVSGSPSSAHTPSDPLPLQPMCALGYLTPAHLPRLLQMWPPH